MIKVNRLEEVLAQFQNIKSLLVVGDVGVDKYSIGNVERISPEAPVPVISVNEEVFKLGLSANVSENLRTLGVKTGILSVVGKDSRGKQLKNLLNDSDISSENVFEIDGRKTTYKERVVAQGQQVCRIDYEETSAIKDDYEQKLIKRIEVLSQDCDGVIIQDYGKGMISKKLVEKVISSFEGKFTSLDPSISKSPHAYEGVSLLKPNLKEALAMIKSLGLEETNPKKIIKFLLKKLKVKMVVMTLGADGMLAMDEFMKEPIHIKTFAKEVFDVSGAGDTSIALLSAALLTDATLEEAMWISNLGAGVVVSKKGTATVTQSELFHYGKYLE